MEERKRIIIEEIRKWQKSRLLPDTYCEFLLSLYLEGEKEEPASAAARTNKIDWLTAALFFLFVTVLLLVQLILDLPPAAGLLLLFTASAVSLAAGVLFRRRGSVFAHPSFLISAGLSFMLLLSISRTLDGGRAFIGMASALLSVGWAFVGWKLKLSYLVIAGASGLLLLTALFIFETF
ncbi:hypothetical protein [Alkalicoccus urumqiensis]|uniref:DUF2157 domain-containing protein n=1 Tax=Alkalicoccus urumqiensis TaxID=1548213 RepID=A0A2P6MFR3_ALKUR|nr:hypothetical protein [Alkalicoccus urumqiensis]PRO65118.1 hypothetical protein C6I21_11770 [Alkalicoccus urumqiensis]